VVALESAILAIHRTVRVHDSMYLKGFDFDMSMAVVSELISNHKDVAEHVKSVVELLTLGPACVCAASDVAMSDSTLTTSKLQLQTMVCTLFLSHSDAVVCQSRAAEMIATFRLLDSTMYDL
jgi:hypothetical protein